MAENLDANKASVCRKSTIYECVQLNLSLNKCLLFEIGNSIAYFVAMIQASALQSVKFM